MKTKRKLLTILLTVCSAVCMMFAVGFALNTKTDSAYAGISVYDITADYDSSKGVITGLAEQFIAGLTVDFEVTAESGYRIKEVSTSPSATGGVNGDVGVTSGIYSFQMPAAATTVTVEFEKCYTITTQVTVAGTGTISVTPENAAAGEEVIVTVDPEDGYRLVSLEGSGGPIGAIAENSFYVPSDEDMSSDTITVTATFAKEYPISAGVAIAGTGTIVIVDNKTTAIAGETIALSTEPAVGYTAPEMSGNIVDVSGSDNIYSFEMPSDAIMGEYEEGVIITASFTKVFNPVYNETDLRTAVADPDGYPIKLMNDITLTQDLVCSNANYALVIDLNDKNLYGSETKGSGWITVATGNVTIKNGTFNGRINAFGDSVVTLADDLTINGYVVVRNIPTDSAYYKATGKPTANISATITSTFYSAVNTNGSDMSNPVVNILEGANITMATDIAVYLPSGTTTISGGQIKGATGVYVKGGSLTITGGTIAANGDANDLVHNDNGANSTGDAVVVEECNYPNGKPVISISEDVLENITSVNASPVASYIFASSPSGVGVLVRKAAKDDGFASDAPFKTEFNAEKVTITADVKTTTQIKIEDIKIFAVGKDGSGAPINVDVTKYFAIKTALNIADDKDVINFTLLSEAELKAKEAILATDTVSSFKVVLSSIERYMTTFSNYINSINNTSIYNGLTNTYTTVMLNNEGTNDVLHQNYNKANKIYTDYIMNLAGFDAAAVEAEFMAQYTAKEFNKAALMAKLTSDNNAINQESLASFFKIRFDVFQKVLDAKKAWDDAVDPNGSVNLLDTDNVKYSTKATFDNLVEIITGPDGLDANQQILFWELVNDYTGAKVDFEETLPAAYAHIESLADAANAAIKLIKALNLTTIELVDLFDTTEQDYFDFTSATANHKIVASSATSIELALDKLNLILDAQTGTAGNGYTLANIAYTDTDFAAEKTALEAYSTMEDAFENYDDARSELDKLKAEAVRVENGFRALGDGRENDFTAVQLSDVNNYKVQQTVIENIKAAYDLLNNTKLYGTYNDMRVFFDHVAYVHTSPSIDDTHTIVDQDTIDFAINYMDEIWTNLTNVLRFNNDIASALKNDKTQDRILVKWYQFTVADADALIKANYGVDFGIVFDAEKETGADKDTYFLYYFDRSAINDLIDFYKTKFATAGTTTELSSALILTSSVGDLSPVNSKRVLNQILQYQDDDTSKKIIGGMLYNFAVHLSNYDIFETDLYQKYAPSATVSVYEADRMQEKLLDNIQDKYDELSEVQQKSFCDHDPKTATEGCVLYDVTYSYSNKNPKVGIHWYQWCEYDKDMRVAFVYREAVEQVKKDADAGNFTIDGYVQTKSLYVLFKALSDKPYSGHYVDGEFYEYEDFYGVQKYCYKAFQDVTAVKDKYDEKFEAGEIVDDAVNTQSMIDTSIEEAIEEYVTGEDSDLQVTIKAIQDAASDLADKVTALEEAKLEMEGDIADLRELIGDFENLNFYLQTNKMTESIVDYLNALYAITGDGETGKTLTDSIDEIRTAIADLITAYTDADADLQAKIDTINDTITNLQSKDSELSDLIAALRTDVDTINNTTIPNLEAKLENADSEIYDFIGSLPSGAQSTTVTGWICDLYNDLRISIEDEVNARVAAIGTVIPEGTASKDVTPEQKATVYGYIYYLVKVEEENRIAEDTAIRALINFDNFNTTGDTVSDIVNKIQKALEDADAAEAKARKEADDAIKAYIGEIPNTTTKTVVTSWISEIEKTLTDKIDQEVADRKAAIDALRVELTALIEAEAATRESEDNAIKAIIEALAKRLDAEDEKIKANLNTLSNTINANIIALNSTIENVKKLFLADFEEFTEEIEKRVATINLQADAIKQLVQAANDAIAVEVSAREEADKQLENSISELAKISSDNDKNLTDRIDALYSTINNINTSFAAEYTKADNEVREAFVRADNELQNTIVTLYKSADEKLKAELDSFNSSLNTKIDNIKSNFDKELAAVKDSITALGKELVDLISKEAATREEADNLIKGVIESLKANDIKTAEDIKALNALIDTNKSAIEVNANSITSIISNLNDIIKSMYGKDYDTTNLATLLITSSNTVDERIKAVVASVESLSSALSALTDRVSALENADESFAKDITDILSKIADINSTDKALAENLASLDATVKANKADIDSKYEGLDKDFNDLSAMFESFIKSIYGDNYDASDLATLLKDSSKSVDTRINNVVKSAEALTSAVSALTDRVSALEAADQSFSSQIAGILATIASMDDTDKAMAAEIKTLDETVKANKADIDSKYSGLDADLQELEDNFKAFVKSIYGDDYDKTDLNTLLKDVSKSVDTRIKAVVASIDSLSSALTALTDRVSALEAADQSFSSQIAGILSDIATLQGKDVDLAGEIAKVVETASKNAEDIKSNADDVAALASDVNKLIKYILGDSYSAANLDTLLLDQEKTVKALVDGSAKKYAELSEKLTETMSFCERQFNDLSELLGELPYLGTKLYTDTSWTYSQWIQRIVDYIGTIPQDVLDAGVDNISAWISKVNKDIRDLIGTEIPAGTASKDVTPEQKATVYGYIYFINKVEEETRIAADDAIMALINFDNFTTKGDTVSEIVNTIQATLEDADTAILNLIGAPEGFADTIYNYIKSVETALNALTETFNAYAETETAAREAGDLNALGEISALETELKAEIQAANGDIQTLSDKVDSYKAKLDEALALKAQLEQKIAAEKAAREIADADLQDQLDTVRVFACVGFGIAIAALATVLGLIVYIVVSKKKAKKASK